MKEKKQRKFLPNFIWGLFSNNRVIQGAKVNPWWVALLIMLVAVCLPVFPIFILTSKSYGAQFIGTYKHNFDNNIAYASIVLREEKKDFILDDSHYLHYEIDGAQQDLAEGEEDILVYQYVNTDTKQIEFEMYFSGSLTRDALKASINLIDAKKYVKGTTTAAGEDEQDTNCYQPSYVLLTPKTIYTKIMKAVDTEKKPMEVAGYTNYVADWKHMKTGKDYKLISKVVLNIKDETIVQEKGNQDYLTAIYKNWRTVFNKSYLTQKSYNIKMSCLLFFAIYLALTFIMGLLVFALTRGKKNIYNYLTFLDTQKIVWWASFSPALLSFIFGLLLTSFAQMLYIILLGLRIMWLSMKQLRPQY